MSDSSGRVESRLITIQTIRHRDTGLIVAMSDEMRGLYVHARTDADLLERIPIAIRDILEADGYDVLDISEVGTSPDTSTGFVPALRKFEASLAVREAA
ncbi:MAG: DUF1902 domain-containing protein [Hyphomicrobiaceae bacterium]